MQRKRVTTASWSLDNNPTYTSSMNNPFLAFVDSVLRGVGQVMFQNNPITGLLFLIGIFYNSWVLGAYAVLSTVASSIAAMLLGAPSNLVRAGLFGFNGTLLGIAFAFFLQPSPLLILYTIVGAAGSTVVMAALLSMLGTWDVPPLTAPFVFTTWFFLFAFYSFTMLHNTQFMGAPALPSPPITTGIITPETFYVGFFKGVGQVFFQNNLVTGIIFLVGILVNSRISALFAGLGSLVGLLVALGLGASSQPVGSGLYGFNPVLTGIALGGVFFVFTWKSTLYALFGIIAATIVFSAIAVALTPLGMPALTAPFVVTTWLFISAKAFFSQLKAVPVGEARSAELNLQRFGQNKEKLEKRRTA